MFLFFRKNVATVQLKIALSQDHYFSNQYYQTLFPVLFTCSPLFISSFLSLFQKQVIFPPHTIPTFSPIFLSNLFESLFPVVFFSKILFFCHSPEIFRFLYTFLLFLSLIIVLTSFFQRLSPLFYMQKSEFGMTLHRKEECFIYESQESLGWVSNVKYYEMSMIHMNFEMQRK